MDINPFHGSLFTGAGTPWGPDPNGPPDFSSDLKNAQGFDTSGLAASMKNSVRENSALQNSQTMGQLAKYGVQGGDQARALESLGSQEDKNLNDVDQNMAQYGYDTKFNNGYLKYMNDLGNYQSGEAGRHAFANGLASLAGMGIGGLTGGMAGAGLGGQIGNSVGQMFGGGQSGGVAQAGGAAPYSPQTLNALTQVPTSPGYGENMNNGLNLGNVSNTVQMDPYLASLANRSNGLGS